MTRDEFYEALRVKTQAEGVTWEIRGGYIRCGDHCPLSFVAGTRACSIYAAAHELAMRVKTAYDIGYEADYGTWPQVPRRKLIIACGLEA